MLTPFQALELSIEIVNSSRHPLNRIAATIFNNNKKWHYSCVNLWPEIIENKIGREARIGDSSGTIHAETACIFEAAFQKGHATEGGAIAVTDPPCPNCIKNMAEAGIVTVYIDHKGFHKDFAQRRIEFFNSLSLRLAEKAGISIYEVNRKDKTIIPIRLADKNYIPINEKPVIFVEDKNKFFSEMDFSTDDKIAIAFCIDEKEHVSQLISKSHPALGFNSAKDDYEITHPETKYSFIQEACNRLLMNAAKRGLQINNKELYCNEIPTSREMVNMIGAGVKRLKILNIKKYRDKSSIEAMQILKQSEIIQFIE